MLWTIIVQYLTLTDIIAAENFNGRVDVKLQQSHWTMKCRLRAPGHSVCLKGMFKTITKQGLILAAIIAAEKQT